MKGLVSLIVHEVHIVHQVASKLLKISFSKKKVHFPDNRNLEFVGFVEFDYFQWNAFIWRGLFISRLHSGNRIIEGLEIHRNVDLAIAFCCRISAEIEAPTLAVVAFSVSSIVFVHDTRALFCVEQHYVVLARLDN
jgi:hypothetical protein